MNGDMGGLQRPDGHDNDTADLIQAMVSQVQLLGTLTQSYDRMAKAFNQLCLGIMILAGVVFFNAIVHWLWGC